ncbi:MAG: phosphatase PAP2 family protein [Candidatus Dojkabacteria bacterium]
MGKNSTKYNIINILIVLLSMILYFPINKFVSGGINLETQVDKQIPLISVFIIPYLIAPVLWIGFIIYANFKFERNNIKRINISFILAGVISSLIYIFIPTFVSRVEVHSNNFFSNLVSWLYANDNAYNAAPSGHTFYTVLCYLFLRKLYPKYNLGFLIVASLIVLSTLFTKQHNIADVIIGIIFALFVYFISKVFT